MRVPVLAFALSLAAALPAFGGTVITNEMTMPNAARRTSVMYLEPDRLRMEGPESVMIFRGDQNAAYVLRPARKIFIRMTAQTLQEAAAAADRARTRILQELKSMPPQQQAQIEKMMGGMMPGAAAAFAYRKTGVTAHFGQWTCERVEQLMDGRPQADLCVVRASDAGLAAGDLAVLHRFSAFMAQGTPQAARSAAALDPQAMQEAIGYPAFPVHVEVPTTKMQTTIATIRNEALPASLFDVPAGYREETMPLPR